MLAIKVQGLRREFGDVVAVAGIDLQVEEGEMFGFLGPNGAGKTTTVRILTTLLRPTDGKVTVAGYDLLRNPLDIRRAIGVALQEAGLHSLATGRETLVLQAELFGSSAGNAKKRAGELLDLVGLADAGDRQVKTYSGGMKRRLDLASALVHEPRLLFLDEPTEGLDPASRASVWQEVQRLNKENGVTVFLTTHYLEEADRLADQLAIIDHGRIVAEGTPEDLKASIGTDVVTVSIAPDQVQQAQGVLRTLEGVTEVQTDADGLTLFVQDGSAAIPQIIRIMDTAGVRVGAVSVSPASLDEVFLRATGSRLEGAAARGESQP